MQSHQRKLPHIWQGLLQLWQERSIHQTVLRTKKAGRPPRENETLDTTEDGQGCSPKTETDTTATRETGQAAGETATGVAQATLVIDVSQETATDHPAELSNEAEPPLTIYTLSLG